MPIQFYNSKVFLMFSSETKLLGLEGPCTKGPSILTVLGDSSKIFLSEKIGEVACYKMILTLNLFEGCERDCKKN